MKQLLSVWLVPQKSDEAYLSSIIKSLATKYDSPLFIPHLTLFGNIEIELEDLKNAIEKVFENVIKFKIKKINVSQSDLFFKTVFIELEKNEFLVKLFQNLSKETIEKNIDEFKPHISLIYKKLPEGEKMKIIKSLEIKNDFIIDRVFINAPKQGDNNFLDIDSWWCVYIKYL